jgi:hypothetical protein
MDLYVYIFLFTIYSAIYLHNEERIFTEYTSKGGIKMKRTLRSKDRYYVALREVFVANSMK